MPARRRGGIKLRTLIFNADDYGLSPAVSRGILTVMRQGLVRSTTVMANLATEAELAELRDYLQAPEGAGRSAGCHLNLSCGPAVSAAYPGRLLRADAGGTATLDKRQALYPATWHDSALREAVWHEWEAQLTLLRAAGLPLTHLDSHHHLHLLPTLFPLALELAREYGLMLRTRPQYRSAAAAAGVGTPALFLEGYFGVDRISRGHLLRMLEDAAAEGCTEIMCHPGEVDELLRQRSGYVEERETELSLLGSTAFTAEVESQGWLLQGYACVLGNGTDGD